MPRLFFSLICTPHDDLRVVVFISVSSDRILSIAIKQGKKDKLIMSVIPRQRGSRRFGLSVEFPLMDSRGVFVIQDRRRLPDRRKEKYGIDDLKVILLKMGSE